MEQLDAVKARIHVFLQSDLAKWAVALRDPQEIWTEQRSLLILELLMYFLALLTFIHAVRGGGRYAYLWLTIILHGLVVESLSYFMPDIDNFWHAQAMLMLLGKRLPLHIVVLYPVFIYTAIVSVSRMRLRAWAEPFAVGLAVVLMDVPFDLVGIKQLFWVWHDTDPNIYDRMYSVPWTSYYFHASFASAFSALFFGTRRLFTRTQRFDADWFPKELFCSLLTGLLAMPLGILQFIPLYHPLHDSLGVHSEVCVLLFLSFYVLVVWSADRHPEREARATDNKGWFDELGLLVFVHFLAYIALAVLQSPELLRSTGLHEPTGNCSENFPVQTAFSQILSKRRFLCTSDYDEPYFDFRCLPGAQPPPNGLSWYTLCGTPHANRIEFILVVSAFSIIGLFVYVQLLAHSGRPIRRARQGIGSKQGARESAIPPGVSKWPPGRIKKD